jgi:hypothetical protein
LHEISLHTNQLLNKLEGINPSLYPGLDPAVHTIVLVLKSARAKAAVDPLPKHLAEVAFAKNLFTSIAPYPCFQQFYALFSAAVDFSYMLLADVYHTPMVVSLEVASLMLLSAIGFSLFVSRQIKENRCPPGQVKPTKWLASWRNMGHLTKRKF